MKLPNRDCFLMEDCECNEIKMQNAAHFHSMLLLSPALEVLYVCSFQLSTIGMYRAATHALYVYKRCFSMDVYGFSTQGFLHFVGQGRNRCSAVERVS